MSQLARRLGRDARGVDVILPFEEVVDALGRVEERYIGLQTIELDSILGTVDRGHGGFDRQFRPTSARVRARWERIANAARRGEALPPISVYRIGDVHFVRDGHHRVSVARALGRDTIDAYVVEVVTRIGAERSLRHQRPALKSHERLFYERGRCPPAPVTASRSPTRGATRCSPRGRGVGLPRRCRTAPSSSTAGPRPALVRARTTPDRRHGRATRAWSRPSETETDAYMRIVGQRYRLMRTHEWSEEILARLREEAS